MAGCASTPTYNPVQSSVNQTVLLNETAIKSISIGMKQDDVHHAMGQELTIGYASQEPGLKDINYKPLTIPNPYKTAAIKTAKGECTAEYYVTAIKQPDGVVSDDELLPLVFCNGVLTAQGWQALKGITVNPAQ